MTLGARIKKARKIAGISRTELAKLSKVPYSTISEIENNEQKTSTKIVELSVALGVNPMWLSTGVGTIGRYDDVAHEIIAKIKTDEDPPEDDDVVVEVVDIELAAGSGSNTVEFFENPGCEYVTPTSITVANRKAFILSPLFGFRRLIATKLRLSKK